MRNVPPNECAVVTTGELTDIELLSPVNMPEGDMVPTTMSYLLAIALRWHRDPDFVAAQIEWLDAQKPLKPEDYNK